MIPVDSEHSAIFQCLKASPEAKIKRILLTASGGPFFGYTAEQLASVTKEQTLAHPTWKMGPKITIDCATLLNKGLEFIEAMRLYRMPPEKISVRYSSFTVTLKPPPSCGPFPITMYISCPSA